MLIVTNDRRFGGVSSRKELNTDDEDGKEIGLPGVMFVFVSSVPHVQATRTRPRHISLENEHSVLRLASIVPPTLFGMHFQVAVLATQ